MSAFDVAYLSMEMDKLRTGGKLKLPSLQDIDVKELIPTTIILKKKIIKSKDEKFLLPPPQNYFAAPIWMVPQMQTMKEELTTVKSRLNGLRVDEWHLHTRNMNPLSSVIKEIRQNVVHEFCTVAWCKLFEILSCHQAIPKSVEEAGHQLGEIELGSVHLCEAPGAFVAALNHYLKTRYGGVRWSWLGTTLSPYYEGNDRSETLIQDQIILSTLDHWAFLEDDTGNVMCGRNILNLREESKKKLRHVHLVTADGSVDCADCPEEQERITSDLHYCEIVAALTILDQGGSLVLKMFTFFECNSISKLYLLSCCFDEVEIIKPGMSKEGNSEVYIVCRGFAGQGLLERELEVLLEFCDHLPKDKSLFPLESIPELFLQRVIDAALYFSTCQALVIHRNVQTYSFGPSLYRLMGSTKRMLAYQWFGMTGLTSLAPEHFVLHLDRAKKKYHFLLKTPQQYGGSYNDRLSRIELKHQPGWLNSLFKELDSLNKNLSCFSVDQEVPRINGYFVKHGKRYENVKCSRFCEDKVLQFNQTVKEYLQYCSQSSPVSSCDSSNLPPPCFCTCMSNADPVKVLCYNSKLLTSALLSSDHDTSSYFFPKLVQTLAELQQGDSLFLCSYPLLTRFHFGFILVLQQIFNAVKIQLQYQPDQRTFSQGILLCNFLGTDHSNSLWSDLQNMLATNSSLSCSQSQAVVEVVPIAKLCRKNLCEKAVHYNNHLVVKSCHWKLEMAKMLFSTQNQQSVDVEMMDNGV